MKTLKQYLESLNEDTHIKVYMGGLYDDTTAGAFLADELNENELELEETFFEVDDWRKILGYIIIKMYPNGK